MNLNNFYQKRLHAHRLIILLILLLIFALIITSQILSSAKVEPQITHSPNVEITIAPKPMPNVSNSYITIGKEDLLQDIKDNYPTTPIRAKQEIIATGLEMQELYNINPLITYFVGHAESSMNPYILHNEVTIKINGKKIRVRAIGLQGIVYEWWGESLIKAGIITNRADLFDPVLNIRAFGFIYNTLYKMPMHKSAKSKEESALLRYFGGDFPAYSKRISSKINYFIANKLYR